MTKYNISLSLIIFFLVAIPTNSIYAQNENPLKTNAELKPIDNIFISFAISFLVVVLIVFVARTILKRGKEKASFIDIFRDRDWYPSLAIFQFFVWTLVIIFGFFGVYLIRVFNGVFEAPTEIPTGLLALMGISVIVPVVSGGVSSIKYKTSDSEESKKKGKAVGFSTMLQEKGKPSLPRFQMFGWTWIGITIYLILLFSNVVEKVDENKFDELILPDLDQALVVLMGMSQGAYLGGKIVTQQEMKITRITPSDQKAGGPITIIGTNFGDNRGFVIFDKNVIRDKIKSWDNSMIEVEIPVGITKGTHPVQVEKDGLLSDEKEYETA